MKRSFAQLIQEGQLVVWDGAMGTMLYNRGIFINACFDMVNLTDPRLVEEIHGEYLAHGAEVIETNTFGANFYKLKKHGLEQHLADINRRGAEIARKVAGDAYVAGAIGPLGIKIEPLGPTSFAEVREAFAQQVVPLLAGGVDLFILETMTHLNELEQAVLAIREHSDLPIVACITVDDDGETIYGTPPEIFTPRLTALPVEVIGVNCSVGPKTMLEVVQTMATLTDKPLIAQPNAGAPRVMDDRTIYLCSPEYMASYARKFIKAGVRMLGGCCGTTPAHVKEIARSVKSMRPMRVELQRVTPRVLTPEHIVAVPLAEKSRFASRIAQGEMVISIELTPPKGWEADDLLQKAQILHERGIDAINIPDGPRASARMSNQILSLLIHNQIGIEPIPHYCCRDRNLLGIQSDLLGLYAAGIHNILLITGDPPKLGDYPDATAVFDVDAIGLTNIVNGLNHGLDLGQNPIKKPTGFLIGVGANPCAVDLEREIKRFFYKVEAGAEYAITQPIFDVAAFRYFYEQIASHRIPIIAGIWPLTSFRNAEFMNNEVPGVVIPDSIMQRMCEAQEKGTAREEGILIAQEMILELKPLIHGVQVSAPFGKLEGALEVISILGR